MRTLTRSHSAQKREGKRPRENSARLSALTGKESQLRARARVRGARRTRSSHPRALPARSGQPQRGRVLREKEEAWSFRDEPMGSGALSGGGVHDQGADWPPRPPVCRYGGSHVRGAGTTSCWRPTRGGAGGRERRVWLERGEGGFLSVRATRWPRWQLRTSARRPREPQPPSPSASPCSPESRRVTPAAPVTGRPRAVALPPPRARSSRSLRRRERSGPAPSRPPPSPPQTRAASEPRPAETEEQGASRRRGHWTWTCRDVPPPTRRPRPDSILRRRH